MKLGDIIKVIPHVGQFLPSKFVAPISPKIVKINGEEYELRYFTFYMPEFGKMIFEDFIEKEGLMEQESKTTDLGSVQTEVFLQSDELKNRGIYYTLSIRKLD